MRLQQRKLRGSKETGNHADSGPTRACSGMTASLWKLLFGHYPAGTGRPEHEND